MTTKFCMLDVDRVSELQEIGAAAQRTANCSAKNTRDGIISIEGEQISTELLDRLAEHFSHHECINFKNGKYFLDRGVGLPFVKSLTDAELRDSGTCIAILIGQGRLDLCCRVNIPKKNRRKFVNQKRLVHYTFIERVQAELDKQADGQIEVALTPSALFSENFLRSLDKNELELLMPCTLQLIMGDGIEVRLIPYDPATTPMETNCVFTPGTNHAGTLQFDFS